MAKSKSGGHRPGGGIKSRNVREQGNRTGKREGASRIRPSGAAQLGQRQGNHVTEQGSTGYGGLEINAGPMGGVGAVKLGNEVALNVKGGGPGKGRTVMPSGSQCMTGAPNKGDPMPKAKALFPGWEK
jgi:hypothetical protein